MLTHVRISTYSVMQYMIGWGQGITSGFYKNVALCMIRITFIVYRHECLYLQCCRSCI